jgi:hypothetical protein
MPIKHLFVEDFFISVLKANPVKEFHKTGNNCHHFSDRLWDIMVAK